MKKLTYLFSIMFALVLMNTSCTKPTDEGVLPYAGQYPDWKNLTWVSTDGISTITTYPRLQISIDNAYNEIKVVQQLTFVVGDTYSGTYTVMTVSGNAVSFTKSNDNAVDVTGTFTDNGTQITLTTKGLSTSNHVYVLKIN